MAGEILQQDSSFILQQDGLAVLQQDGGGGGAVPPDPPTGGTLSDNGNGTVTRTFFPPAVDGGAPITLYTVTLSTGQTASGASSPIIVAAVPGVACTATVTATNSAGTGAASSVSNSVTPARTVAATFYVNASTGSNTNTGLVGFPWQTNARFNAFTFMAGDRVVFDTSASHTGPFTLTNNGTSGAYICLGTGRLTPANAGTTRIAQASPATILAGNGNGVNLNDCQYVSVDNLIVSGSGVNLSNGVTTSTGQAISLKSTQATNKLLGVRVTACTATDTKHGIGAFTSDTTKVGYDGLQIWGCKVHATQSTTICVVDYNLATETGTFPQGNKTQFANIYIGYCEVYDVPGLPGGTGVGLCGVGPFVRNCTTGLVEYNVAHDINAVGDQGSVGGTAAFSTAIVDGITFRANEAYNIFAPQPTPVDGCGGNCESGSTNCVWEYNYFHDNDGMAMLTGTIVASSNSGNIFRYNVFARNAINNGAEIKNFGGQGAGAGQTPSGTYYNNTVYASNGDAYQTIFGGVDYIYNNILVCEAGAKCLSAAGLGVGDAQGNLYYALGGGAIDIDGSTSLAAWRLRGSPAYETPSRGVVGNPLLTSPGSGVGTGTLPGANVSTVSYFDLLPPSPAADVGIDLSGSFTITRDFRNNSPLVGAAYDIGAIEYIPASAPSTPAAPVATRGNAQASVALVAPSDGGSAITGMTVTSSPAGGTDTHAGTTGLTHVITGLVNGTPYTFTFTATNAAGTSSASPASNSVTPGTVPGAPTIGTATAGVGSADVSFTAPVSNGGLAINSYRAISSPGGHTGTINQAGSGSITVDGLDEITYTFSVRCTNDAGNSAESGDSNSITPEAAAESSAGVATVAGSTIAVSVVLPDTYDAAGYTALTYTDIGEITDLGAGYGRIYSTTTRAPIDSPQVTQRKSFYTQPPIDYLMAWSQSDAGQDLLRAAANDRSTLTFALTIQGGDIRYFTAQVQRMVESHGTVDNLRQGALTLLLQGDIVAYPA